MLWSSANISSSSNSFLLYIPPGYYFPHLLLAACPIMNIRYPYGTESVMNSGVTFSYPSICGCGWYSVVVWVVIPMSAMSLSITVWVQWVKQLVGQPFHPSPLRRSCCVRMKNTSNKLETLAVSRMFQWEECVSLYEKKEMNDKPTVPKYYLFYMSSAWILQWLIIVCADTFCAVPFLINTLEA